MAVPHYNLIKEFHYSIEYNTLQIVHNCDMTTTHITKCPSVEMHTTTITHHF